MSSYLSKFMDLAQRHPKTSLAAGLATASGLAYLGYKQWTKPKAVSGHWVGSTPVLPTSRMSQGVRSYLTDTHMNIQHGDMDTVVRRAGAHNFWQDTENRIIGDTRTELRDHNSAVFQMSSHMVHNERWVMGERARTLRTTHADTAGATLGQEVTRMTTSRSQGSGQAYADMVDMMVHGKQGPMTFEQSRLGVEATIVGHHVLDKTPQYGPQNPRMQATRPNDPETGRPSHPTTSRHGIDLSLDPGTRLRDALGLPVMTGTSGSASDVIRSYRHTSDALQQAMPHAPTMDPSANRQALKELTFNWMRRGKPMETVRSMISDNFQANNFQKISAPPAPATQTHSFPEIAAGVDLTLDGNSHHNLAASSLGALGFMLGKHV